MNNKEKILQATIQAFNQKGLKFTMDDIASILAMSKKTIYTIFKDKNTLFMEMVDYLFDTIKESESEIIEDNTLSTIEKIRRILGVMPESYKDIDLRQLYMLKDKFPEIYRHVEERLENGWETTIKLLEQGIDTLILGCTHYPLLRSLIQKLVGDSVTLVNPAYETAKELERLLKSKGLENLQDVQEEFPYRFYVSDLAEKFKDFANSILPYNVEKTQKIDIEKY